MDRHAHSREGHGTPHVHGAIDATILTAERGVWAVKWSLVLLALTAALQMTVVVFTGSVALFADTVHNLGDAATAIPLWIAFRLASRPPSRRFTYGLGRFEDLAGIFVVLTILASALLAGWESVGRLLDPQPVQHLWAVAVAAIIGFFGNQAVAAIRIRVGREIASAALVADGQHARADALTSLGVLGSVAGVWLGFPLADPIVGLAITAVILRIVWQSGKTVLARVADGVDPQVISAIETELDGIAGVERVSAVRARWLGHRMRAEVAIAVAGEITVTAGHAIAEEVRHRLLDRLPYLSDVIVHVDPVGASGEAS